MTRQYAKNIGRTLSVKLQSDKKIEGELTHADDSKITLEWKAREPKPIGKGKVTVNKKEELAYNHAQKLIEELSENIYKLAQEQAEKGQLNLAIQSIDLIPDNSQIYSIAQETKINWQKRLNQ